MRVLLEGGFPFEGRDERPERVDLLGAEGDSGVLFGSAVPGLHQLHDDGGGLGGDGDQLEQALGGIQLAILELKTLLLEGAEELLDGPTLAVPTHDPPSHGLVRHLVGGEQPPQDRLGARRRIDLRDLHQG